MIGAMTLGIGDIICLPSAITQRYEMSEKYYSITFWYDENGCFVGKYEGDIREHDYSSWYNGRESMEINQTIDSDEE